MKTGQGISATSFVSSALLVAVFSGWPYTAAADLDAALRRAADTYLEHHLRVYPLDAYFHDLDPGRHHRFTDNRRESLRRFHSLQDAALLAASAIDPARLGSDAARTFQAKWMSWLSAERGARVCRRELWSVDHMVGVHAQLQLLVRVQPVESDIERADALARWREAAAYLDRETDNLRDGLAAGYSAPKSVVRRVVAQLDALNTAPVDRHPYLALAERAGDAAFNQAFRALLETRLQPAMRRYQRFLAGEYLAGAREALAITANPRGRSCYMALYQRYTRLSRTPEEVHRLGLAAVEANRAAVVRLGESLYGVDSYGAAVAAANNDPRQAIPDPGTYQRFLEEVVARSEALTRGVVRRMPGTTLLVEPLPPFRQGQGVSAHYAAGVDGGPGRFIYDPATFDATSFGQAEILAVHEGYPGHHLQVALSQERETWHPLDRLLTHSAYTEGWARYAETLAEEVGIYRTDAARILRRTWPARGMVLDTGLHILGWSRQQLLDFMAASGRTEMIANPDDLFDRMAVLPAQLTSYDSGALELFALRSQMQDAQRDDFSLEAFHELVLGGGELPLTLLRHRIEALLDAGSAPGRGGGRAPP